jgi:hypothetical protein
MADETVVAPSPTEETTFSPNGLSGQERKDWLLKGTPMPKDTAEPAPAKKPSEPAKAEPIAPAADTGSLEEPKGRAGQRIQELLGERAELRARLAALEKKPVGKPAESAPAKPAAAAAAAPASASGEPQPPDPTKWTGTWEELEAAKIAYLRDLTKWELGKADREKAAATQQTEVSELQRAYKVRADGFLAADPEYADAQEIIGKFVTAKGVSELILESEVGPEIVMHLYKLPNEEQQRVAKLSPLALAREITRIEAKLSKGGGEPPAAAIPTTPITRKTSAAKAPATELSGAKAASNVDEAEQALANGDIGTYIRVMNARAIKKN